MIALPTGRVLNMCVYRAFKFNLPNWRVNNNNNKKLFLFINSLFSYVERILAQKNLQKLVLLYKLSLYSGRVS